MKEQLLQLKQDIVDISNDLTANLADKGVEATGTLSELVNQVKDIQGGYNPLAEIGWNLSEQPYLKDAIEYAQEILVNPKSTYQNDKRLVIFPKVDQVELKNSMFANSNLTLFPDGVKLTGNLSSCFADTPIQSIDLTELNSNNLNNTFNNCKHLTYVKVNENFGKGVTSFNYTFSNCNNLKSLDYINVSDCTHLGNCFTLCKKLEYVPPIDISNILYANNLFEECNSLKSVTITGDYSKIANNNNMFTGCDSLTYLSIPEDFPIISTSYGYGIIEGIKVPKIIGSFNYKSVTAYGTQYYYWICGFSQNTYTRYMIIKNLGYYQSGSYLNMEYSRVWGIANDEVPDARQSLIDSLITYSFDRATAGYSTMTMKLYKDVKALLTEDEIAQITAKGYTLI